MRGTADLNGDRIALGIAYMVAGIFCLATMDSLAKWLGERYPIQQVAFFRGFFALIPVAVLVAMSGGLRSLRSHRPGLHLLRGLLATLSLFCFITALRFLPLAEATAISFATPLFVTALSVPLLRERVGPRRWAAVLVGFLGVLVMVRPGVAAFQPASLLVLGTAFGYGLVMLTARRFAASETTAAMVFYVTLVPLIAAALLLPFGWRTPEPAHLPQFVAIGLLGGMAMLFLTLAFRHAPAAVCAPFDYTALVWAAVIGWMVWRDFPEPVVWLGAAIVVASGLYIIHRETRRGI